MCLKTHLRTTDFFKRSFISDDFDIFKKKRGKNEKLFQLLETYKSYNATATQVLLKQVLNKKISEILNHNWSLRTV